MMRLMSSGWVHRRCVCEHIDAFDGTRVHRMHYREAG
jgi:hypothetical protein